MQPAVLFAFFGLSGAAWSMCAAGVVLLAIGLSFAKNDIAQARGIDKIVALTSVCFAIPLAVFGAEHLSLPQALAAAVPSYMPGRMFWVYFVGLALIASSLSIAVKRQVRWSGLLFGVMMFLFVAMLHLPAAIATGSRIPWTVVVREMSFGGAGWVLAGIAMAGDRSEPGRRLIIVGRSLIAITTLFFGVQHFLHPLGLPVVPLAKQMPTWIPAAAAIDYVTGAFLLVAGVCFLLAQKTRLASAYLGGWILLLVVVVYGPVLVGALGDPNTGVQVEGLNYFADTLLFGGVVLSLSGAAPG
jgi:uncharacterized membrane protein